MKKFVSKHNLSLEQARPTAVGERDEIERSSYYAYTLYLLKNFKTMYDTSKIGKDTDLFDKITEYDVFAHYIGNFKIGSVFKSPLRKDNNPSFGIFVSKRTGGLLYKDLATGDTGNCINFVKKYLGLTTYKDVYNTIKNDISIGNLKRVDTTKIPKKQNVKFAIKRKPFSKNELLYWEKYCITLEILKLYNVFAISAFFINDNICKTYTTNEPMFAYKVFNNFKIYRPFSAKSEKWYSNTTRNDMQGYEQLPETGDVLIITKALKDVMCLYSLGYNAIAPSSETSVIPVMVMNNLKKRFKRIIVLYDRDIAGVNGTRKMLHNYTYLDYMFIPKTYNTKDISDTIETHGLDVATNIIQLNLNKIFKRWKY